MAQQQDNRPRRQRVVVRWGCDLHRTPAGEDCTWCVQQGELFPRDRAATHRTRRTR